MCGASIRNRLNLHFQILQVADPLNTCRDDVLEIRITKYDRINKDPAGPLGQSALDYFGAGDVLGNQFHEAYAISDSSMVNIGLPSFRDEDFIRRAFDSINGIKGSQGRPRPRTGAVDLRLSARSNRSVFLGTSFYKFEQSWRTHRETTEEFYLRALLDKLNNDHPGCRVRLLQGGFDTASSNPISWECLLRWPNIQFTLQVHETALEAINAPSSEDSEANQEASVHEADLPSLFKHDWANFDTRGFMLLQTVGDQTKLKRYGPYGHYLRELDRHRLFLAVSDDMRFITRGVKALPQLYRVKREGESHKVIFQRKEVLIMNSWPVG